MEQSSGRTGKDDALAVVRYLAELDATDPVLLDVSGHSSVTDFFIVGGATSAAQLRGLQRRLFDFLKDREIEARQSPRRNDESGWILIDCDYMVVHLMLSEQREFYELEKLWFDADRLYPATEKT